MDTAENLMNCPHCGERNKASVGVCMKCQRPLTLGQPGRHEPIFDMRDTESMADKQRPVRRAVARRQAHADRELYDLAIGQQSRAYYLARFGAFDAEGATSLAWHWPSFFFTFWWLLYRKMWSQAAIYLAASCLIAVATFAATSISPGVAALGYGAYLIGVYFVPALIANSVYYWHCQNLIAQARATSPDPEVQLGVLIAKGGTANAAAIRTLALVCVVIALVVAAAAQPIREAYSSRATTDN